MATRASRHPMDRPHADRGHLTWRTLYISGLQLHISGLQCVSSSPRAPIRWCATRSISSSCSAGQASERLGQRHHGGPVPSLRHGSVCSRVRGEEEYLLATFPHAYPACAARVTGCGRGSRLAAGRPADRQAVLADRHQGTGRRLALAAAPPLPAVRSGRGGACGLRPLSSGNRVLCPGGLGCMAFAC